MIAVRNRSLAFCWQGYALAGFSLMVFDAVAHFVEQARNKAWAQTNTKRNHYMKGLPYENLSLPRDGQCKF